MSFKRIEELKRAFKADDEEALSGLINMRCELPKTVNIGMIDLGVEFNTSYCSMLAARNLGLTSMEKQCKKTSRHWPPSTMGIACAMMLTPRMWRRRCGLFSMRRRRSGKNSKKDWLLRNPRIPKRMRWRRQEPSRATASKRGRGRTGAQERPRVCIHQTRWTSRPTSSNIFGGGCRRGGRGR